MAARIRLVKPKPHRQKTLADYCAATIGSWVFIGSQATILALWIIFNLTLPDKHKWDGHPFILLNLMLSFQAAFTGPVLLMAANRQSEIDRKRDIDHYLIDVHDSELLMELASQVEHIHKYVEGHDEEHW